MTQTIEQATSVASLPPSNGKAHPGRDVAVQLQQLRPQLAAALPSHIPVERFERVVLTAININPDLLDCDRRSLFTSCNKAANDGLMPDGREGALVAFRDKKTGKKIVTWLPMVFGLIKKMRQSGEVSTISAQVVHENDQFSYVLGDDERIEHKPLLVGDRGKPILVYAIAKLKDGGIQREILTAADVEKARKISRAPDSLMWRDFWAEGARKTAIKRLAKYLPLSAEDRRALDRDETEFEGLKRDAMLAKAAEQISAPAAIAHQPAIDDVEVIDAPQGEVETLIGDGSAAESAATLARLLAVLPDLSDAGELARWKAEVKAEIASLTDDDRGAFNTAYLQREAAVTPKRK